jgi:glucosamine-6-phosphate deaminase
VIDNERILENKRFRIREKIPTMICETPTDAAGRVAATIASKIIEHNALDKPTVLGLATGHTPIGVYRELIRLHREEGLDFSRTITFNLDEYFPMQPGRIQSYHRWMHENFFDHVNIPRESIHIPDGTLGEGEIEAFCNEYEREIRRAGGIDIQLLGIGRTGHIGFNEPGSSPESRTRLIHLDPVTRKDAAADFFGEENVPRRAVTMGVGTILVARQVLLMAFGEQKAPIVRRAVEGEVTDSVAASHLQGHENALVIVDRAAGAELTRVATPWLLGDVDWTESNQFKAVVWLSLTTGKSLLKLDQDDYDSHHLAALVRRHDSPDNLNRSVFHRLAGTIVTKDSMPSGKTMLCFSPHPDDDVISMGGTLTRLVERGNKVHVAYMTSGNIAVFDEHVMQMLKFWAELSRDFGSSGDSIGPLVSKVGEFLESKSPGEIDSTEVQQIKTRIRYSEALAACRWMGIDESNAHFLDLPFYKTGEVRKRPIGEDDVRIVASLLDEVRPDWIFVAGEMSDPHGTHRLCAEAIFKAMDQLDESVRPEQVWLYRGAWQEWPPEAIDMAVPLTHSELEHKIFGIFKHQSQKDKALFPGPYDDREFWQRAEARNTETAGLFNQLGLPEYYAMEALVRYAGA